MFKELTNFYYKRTSSQAFGFYLSYFTIGFISIFTIGYLLGLLGIINTYEEGLSAGNILAIVFSTAITYYVARAKNSLGEFKTILLIVLSAALSAVAGLLLGLIPVSFLTKK